MITNAVRRAGTNACDLVLPKRRADQVDPESVIDNTSGEISHAASIMLARTSDCTDWRGDQPDDPIAANPQVRWPPPRSRWRPLSIDEAERDGA